MNLTPDIQELLEKYVQGELEGEEIAGFEELMESDAALKAEVEKQLQLQRLLEAGVYKIGVNRLVESFVETHRRLTQEEAGTGSKPDEESLGSTPPTVGRKWLWLAAAVVIMLGIIYFAIPGLFPPQPQDCRSILASAEFQPPPLSGNRGVSRGGSMPTEAFQILSMADQNYSKGNFEPARDQYREALAQAPDLKNDSETLIYFGISSMETGGYTKARSLLETVRKNPEEFVWKDKADWYLVILYLKECQTDSALKLLQGISKQDDHEYKERAFRLLKSK